MTKGTRRIAIGLLLAVMLAVPAIAYVGNSNPMCYLVERYSLEWYVLWCNYTEQG